MLKRTTFTSPVKRKELFQKTRDSALDEPAELFYFPTMSKTAKVGDSAKDNGLPFEEALQKLETIVETMETGDLPLEMLIARYEEGVRLTKICQEKLAEAELKIQQLEKNIAGEMKLKPLDLVEE